MKAIIIMADDRIGLIADISYLLGKAKINIEAISVDVVANKAVISLTVKDDTKAKSVLTNAGYSVADTNVIVVKLTDQPGELGIITNLLAKEKINIQNLQILSRDGKNTILSLVVDNPKKAQKLLESYLLNKNENMP